MNIELMPDISIYIRYILYSKKFIGVVLTLNKRSDIIFSTD